MRYVKRALLAGIVACAAAGSAACDNTLAPDINWRLQVALTEGSNRPGVGDQIRFGAFVVNAFGTPNITEDSVNVTALSTWTYIGQPGIVSVSPTGMVTALAPGAVAIQATYAGKTSDMSLVVE